MQPARNSAPPTPVKQYFKFTQYSNRGNAQGDRAIRFGGYPLARYPKIKELYRLENQEPHLVTITVDRHAITMKTFDYKNMLIKIKEAREEISAFEDWKFQSDKENRGNR